MKVIGSLFYHTMAREDLGKIVILGGGMMGCSVAYHLADLGVKCTIVERNEVACAASGKAGGFLAKTWCDGSAVGSLARASFDLHAKYGNMFDSDYRVVDTLEVGIDESSSRRISNGRCPTWLDKQGLCSAKILGNQQNTAQVHPGKMTKCFLDSALRRGSKLIKAEACGIEFSADGKYPKAVQLQGQPNLSCNTLVLALGPWTSIANRWFDYQLPLVKAERAHSIVMKPKSAVTAHALFVCYKEKCGKSLDPEIYPRPDGTVYMCGFTDSTPLPEAPEEVTPNKSLCERLHSMAGTLSTALEGSEVLLEQACYLPVPADGVPYIGRVFGYENVYIAAGHYCWGILNGPATGKALADLLVLGESSDIDLSPFDPSNFV